MPPGRRLSEQDTPKCPKWLFPLDLVKGVLTKSRAELLKAFFDLFIYTALDADLRAIVEVTGFGALQPYIFTVHLFGQGSAPVLQKEKAGDRLTPTPSKESIRDHSTISVIRPEPTVRPPSRIAKVKPASIAMGLSPKSMDIWTLSPGMHISAPMSSNFPVTSVVRK